MRGNEHRGILLHLLQFLVEGKRDETKYRYAPRIARFVRRQFVFLFNDFAQLRVGAAGNKYRATDGEATSRLVVLLLIMLFQFPVYLTGTVSGHEAVSNAAAENIKKSRRPICHCTWSNKRRAIVSASYRHSK